MKRFMTLFLCAFLFFSAGGLFAVVPLEGVITPNGLAAGIVAHEARLKLLAVAEKYQGTPYQYAGTGTRGLDCSGLVYLSFREALSVAVPRSTLALYGWVEKIHLENLQPGDLLFFATLGKGNGTISHVGIYAGDGMFIHSASEGPKTGVIYSRMDESYWQQNFVSAGRALPEGSDFAAGNAALAGAPVVNMPETGGSGIDTGKGIWGAGKNGADTDSSSGRKGKLFAGIGIAPSLNGFLDGGYVFRGASSQLRLAYGISIFDKPFLIGLELRPEWDNALGVFRTPLTFSLGLDDRFRIFAGPSLSFGDPVLQIDGEKRRYTGGNSWIGAVGITVAPFSFNTKWGKLAPYGELAWQSYFRESGTDRNQSADFNAGLRFSTGIHFTIEL
jgi:probable lipoprotein NlpC